MPVYTYRCGQCGIEKRVLKSVKEYDTIEFCDDCETPVEKIATAAAYIGPRAARSGSMTPAHES